MPNKGPPETTVFGAMEVPAARPIANTEPAPLELKARLEQQTPPENRPRPTPPRPQKPIQDPRRETSNSDPMPLLMTPVVPKDTGAPAKSPAPSPSPGEVSGPWQAARALWTELPSTLRKFVATALVVPAVIYASNYLLGVNLVAALIGKSGPPAKELTEVTESIQVLQGSMATNLTMLNNAISQLNNIDAKVNSIEDQTVLLSRQACEKENQRYSQCEYRYVRPQAVPQAVPRTVPGTTVTILPNTPVKE